MRSGFHRICVSVAILVCVPDTGYTWFVVLKSLEKAFKLSPKKPVLMALLDEYVFLPAQSYEFDLRRIAGFRMVFRLSEVGLQTDPRL